MAVHLLTASGAVFGLLALRHAAVQEWTATFLWLGAALAVDAADGPLARRTGVDKLLPAFSGVRLDLVVDYLTYCAVPAFIVMESGVAGSGLTAGLFAGAVILLSSLFHFAHLESKTEDGFFVGFPALWNVVSLYLFVLKPEPGTALAAILLLAAATFVPVKWVHPVRVAFLRPVTLSVTACWAAAALIEVIQGFPGNRIAQAVFVAAAVYIVALGLWRTARPPVWPGRMNPEPGTRDRHD
jgi:phosphatidylcholine synthase